MTIDTQQKLLDYWLVKKGDKLAPTRKEMEVLDFPRLWGSILVYNVVNDPLDFQVCYAGGRMVEYWEKDYTGYLLSEMLTGPIKDKIKSQFEKAAITAEYSIEELDSSWTGKDYFKYTRLMLPVSDDGERVNKLFACIFFEE